MENQKQQGRLKLVSAFLTLTLVVPFSALAQVSYLSQNYTQPNPFFYEVEKDGKVSHILGSMHAGIPLSSYPQSIFQEATKATTMIFESDPDEFNKNFSEDVLAAAVYPEGQSLEQNISPKAVKKLKELFGEKNFDQLNKYKPWAIANELGNQGLKNIKQQNPELWDAKNGIDMTLLKYAKKVNKPTIFVDDLSKKVSSFEQDTTAEDLEKMLSYPDPLGHIVSCVNMAQRYYLAGNEQGFKEYNKSCETESFLNRLQQRSISWVPKMEPTLKTGGAFIVVGADHMNGPNGLEALLTAKGYNVKRINASPSSTSTYKGDSTSYAPAGYR